MLLWMVSIYLHIQNVKNSYKIQKILSRIKEIEITSDELTELTGYMSEFVSDVDLSYERKID